MSAPTNKITPYGCLYGISLGPGDPGLITRRAWELLHGSLRWVYPIPRLQAPSYALEIVNRAGMITPATALPLLFPMTTDRLRLAQAWLAAANQVVHYLRQGEDVGFLVEGDASTYATFSYLAANVKALTPEVEITILPGVSAYQAAAAALHKPLAQTQEAFAILPASRAINQLEALFEAFDTLVILKIKAHIQPLLAEMKHLDILHHASFVERIGTPAQRILHGSDLDSEDLHYLSLLLLHKPTSQVQT